MLRLYDSARRGRVVDVVPRDEGFSMYVCGPTVDNLPAHRTRPFHARLGRRATLVHLPGTRRHYVSNVTDIDDKIIARAASSGREVDVAAEYEREWWEAMDRLGVPRPITCRTRPTTSPDGRDDRVAARHGHAYRTTTGSTSTSHGPRLRAARRPAPRELRAGARVEAIDEKRSPLDFALWKNAKPDEPRWARALRRGRPGWHTECVVMSLDLLGEDFDLHCGGQDLKFPHHENERAQAVAAANPSRPLGAQRVGDGDGVKMSQVAQQLHVADRPARARTDPRAYRLLVLRSHYRSPIEVTPRRSPTPSARWRASTPWPVASICRCSPARRFEVASAHVWAEESLELYERVVALMNDDLNTPLAVAELFDALSGRERHGGRRARGQRPTPGQVSERALRGVGPGLTRR
jgi:cysteinyl-tRNA synthetase